MAETVAAELPHLPFYVNPPGQTDTMMISVAVFLVGLVLLVGVIYLSLHSLPEKMAHGRVQMELVAVLALIGLFAHNLAFWVAALLLALVRFPDFGSIFQSMSDSLSRLAPRPEPEAAVVAAPDVENPPDLSDSDTAKEG